jgi:predicted TIM-barrel fold metal-dependent hydrolase
VTATQASIIGVKQEDSVNAFPKWMISVDDHVLEPGHVWQTRVPAKLRERAPRLISTDAGTVWEFDGQQYPTAGLAAAVAPGGAVSMDPLDYADLSQGCYEPKARVADMDRNHVLASLCFPSFPRFAGQLFSVGKDKELGLACVRAYNDWMIEEWAGTVPGRLMPLVVLPYWDAKLAVAEIERCAALGAAAVAFSENPSKLGFPSIHDANYYWDPVFATAADAQLPICMHMGSSSTLPQTSADAPYVVSFALAPTSSMYTLYDWLFSGQFIRHPNLKIALSEGGIGWIPYMLHRASWVLERNTDWVEGESEVDTSAAWLATQVQGARSERIEVPIEQLFREHVYGCFIDDPVGIGAINAIGVDNIMLETDYPHVDSTYPNSWESAQQQLAGLDAKSTYKIVQGNARRLFKTFQFAELD